MSVPVAMIAAVARNGVIGASQSIPWTIPSDMAHFRRTTLGKPIIMGRRQFETVGRKLPGRTNIVVTRQEGYEKPGITVKSSLEDAIAEAQDVAARDGASEIIIIGGGEIYTLAMPIADRLYVSHVDLEPEGEVIFPPIDPGVWIASGAIEVEPDPRDDAAFRVVVYTRRSPAF